MRDGVDQRVVFAPAEAGNSTGGCVERLADSVAAGLDFGKNIGGLELLQILRGMSDLDGLIAMQDSMAEGLVAGSDSGELDRNHLVVEQCEQPAHRANEAFRLAWAPVHILGPVKRGEFFGKLSGKDSGRGLPFAENLGGNVFAFGGGGF